MNMALPILVDDSGNTASSIEQKCQMLIDHGFPISPLIHAMIISLNLQVTSIYQTWRSEMSLELGP
jgi:hypothetical protein